MNFTIVPRGIWGWLQTAVWLALLAPLVLWFSEHVNRPAYEAMADGQTDFGAVVFLFCLGLLAWLIGGIWWMVSHAEVIEMAVVLREREEQLQRRRKERAR